MCELNRLNSQDSGFDAALERLLDWDQTTDPAVESVVRDVIADVRARGDAAVIDYTQRFDRWSVAAATELEISIDACQQALLALDLSQREALELAAERIRAYAGHQKMQSWSYTESDGTLLGQQVTPLDRAGLYVPGGKAAYPSSVLMNAIPAKVAGVTELIMVVPTPAGEVNNMVLAAAAIAGVDRVFAVGGAQAVAALAYGTATIPAVDKIVPTWPLPSAWCLARSVST
jgi:histidinol dehydrogenase